MAENQEHVNQAGEKHLKALHRQWAVQALAYFLLTAAIAVLIGGDWSAHFALRWLGMTALILSAVMWLARRRLTANLPPEETTLYPTIGPANHLSIFRGVLLAWLAGFLFLPRPDGWLAWSAGVLYTTAIVIDYVDGVVARISQQPSVMGEMLDTDYDALGILIAPLLGIWWGQLPLWYVLVAAAYYLFMIGKWHRERVGKPVYPLPPSRIRRPMAGIQMGFISAVLWPVLPPSLTYPAATIVMLPFTLGFIRDWVVVSGYVDADSVHYQWLADHASNIAYRWLPLALRLGVGTGTMLFISAISDTNLSAGRLLLLAGLAVLVVTGISGRLAATLLAIFTALTVVKSGVHPAGIMAFMCGLGLMLTGTGVLSIWQPEEIFLQSRYGGQQ